MNYNDEISLLKSNDEGLFDLEQIVMVSKSNEVDAEDFNKTIQFITESGEEMSCTYEKFLEIFDEEGLAGFIM